VLTAARDASRTGEDVALAVSEAGEWCRDEEQRSAAIGLAAAWQVAQRTGAPAARVLDQLAVGLRSDEDARGAAAAAMAGPRATARLLAWLPAAGLLLGQLIGADPVAVLAGTRLGRLSAVLGGVLAVAGWLWTRRLLRAASAP
jgi:tight adherence protein B